ncbi:stage V sporulation protein AE [Texcoconibacillus texcoconensis]|uniref:Stage V sporulation protein AE n=1 Tax=Texcoconibacillus texcoconensis TaxID=1095777 RepID=A0A840QNN3_9BACI|nr:stage V sporulation protein AE [Texcoconibacillus texcoconensis]MBB5172979.1 stage V sporulation protein AE [Texcoconibacillus texcoconensis]
MAEYIVAFITGGIVVMVGQLLMDLLQLSSAQLMVIFVVSGAILDGFHLYDRFIDFAGAGALVQMSSFGHFLVHGAMAEGERSGFLGVSMGLFEMTSASFTTVIVVSFFVAIMFRAKG